MFSDKAKAKVQPAAVPQGRSVLRPGNRHLRDVSRESGSSFVAGSSSRHDGPGLNPQSTERTQRKWKRGWEGVTGVPLRKPVELRHERTRWRKRFGRPTCLLEVILQRTWLLVPYIAIVVTFMLILMVKGK